MISITAKQKAQISEIEFKKFKHKLRVHLEKFFPERIRGVSDDEFGNFARFTTDKAKEFELHTERAVAYFSNIIMILGADFDRERTNTFAVRILRDERAGLHPEDRVKVAMNLAHQLQGKGALRRHE